MNASVFVFRVSLQLTSGTPLARAGPLAIAIAPAVSFLQSLTASIPIQHPTVGNSTISTEGLLLFYHRHLLLCRSIALFVDQYTRKQPGTPFRKSGLQSEMGQFRQSGYSDHPIRLAISISYDLCGFQLMLHNQSTLMQIIELCCKEGSRCTGGGRRVVH